MRINKYIASCGVASRRKAEEFIAEGLVKVNGAIVTNLATDIDETKDVVTVNDQKISLKSDNVYYMLNKPKGYVTTMSDEKDRKSIVDLISSIDNRIYPVGRLDYDTTGLLILTNDGDFANLLSHPSNNVEKTYRATIDGILSVDEIYALKDGIDIDGVKVIPTRVKVKKKNINKNTQIVELSIVEGRNHIVKRVFEAIGHPVLKLKRERYAFLDVEDLRIGEYRDLTLKEVKKLKELKK